MCARGRTHRVDQPQIQHRLVLPEPWVCLSERCCQHAFKWAQALQSLSDRQRLLEM